jgi:hypothetical protein
MTSGARTGKEADGGSASLWLLALMMVVWVVAAAFVVGGVAIAARHRAATAADLSALAGAAALAKAVQDSAAMNGSATPSRPEDMVLRGIACAAAESTAAANGAQLLRCDVDGLTVAVIASVQVRGLAHLAARSGDSVTARAKAGPR